MTYPPTQGSRDWHPRWRQRRKYKMLNKANHQQKFKQAKSEAVGWKARKLTAREKRIIACRGWKILENDLSIVLCYRWGSGDPKIWVAFARPTVRWQNRTWTRASGLLIPLLQWRGRENHGKCCQTGLVISGLQEQLQPGAAGAWESLQVSSAHPWAWASVFTIPENKGLVCSGCRGGNAQFSKSTRCFQGPGSFLSLLLER